MDNEQQSLQTQGKEKQSGTVFIVLGWVFFALSLILIPILFGAGTVIMGYLVKRNGKDVHGVILMVFGVAGAILGSLLGFIVALISY